MSRAVKVGSLTVGRCYYSAPPEGSWGDGPRPAGGPLADPRWVYRIEDVGESTTAISATGERTIVPNETLVTEVPRGSFDRLLKK